MEPRGWITTLVTFVVAAFATEALPPFLGTGVRAKVDWSFVYVSMKFVTLPAAGLLILALLERARGATALSVWPAFTGVVAMLYLVSLYVWPVPWFV